MDNLSDVSTNATSLGELLFGIVDRHITGDLRNYCEVIKQAEHELFGAGLAMETAENKAWLYYLSDTARAIATDLKPKERAAIRRGNYGAIPAPPGRDWRELTETAV